MMESTNETGEVLWADVACELDISAKRRVIGIPCEHGPITAQRHSCWRLTERVSGPAVMSLCHLCSHQTRTHTKLIRPHLRSDAATCHCVTVFFVTLAQFLSHFLCFLFGISINIGQLINIFIVIYILYTDPVVKKGSLILFFKT